MRIKGVLLAAAPCSGAANKKKCIWKIFFITFISFSDSGCVAS